MMLTRLARYGDLRIAPGLARLLVGEEVYGMGVVGCGSGLMSPKGRNTSERVRPAR